MCPSPLSPSDRQCLRNLLRALKLLLLIYDFTPEVVQVFWLGFLLDLVGVERVQFATIANPDLRRGERGSGIVFLLDRFRRLGKEVVDVLIGVPYCVFLSVVVVEDCRCAKLCSSGIGISLPPHRSIDDAELYLQHGFHVFALVLRVDALNDQVLCKTEMSDTTEKEDGPGCRLTQTTLLLSSVQDLFFASTLHEQLEHPHLEKACGQIRFSGVGKRR